MRLNARQRFALHAATNKLFDIRSYKRPDHFCSDCEYLIRWAVEAALIGYDGRRGRKRKP